MAGRKHEPDRPAESPPGQPPAIQVHPQFLRDLAHWIEHEPRVALRLVRMVFETARDPFRGIGKPEPLKNRPGAPWSRRLTAGDRFVYRFERGTLFAISARSHYDEH